MVVFYGNTMETPIPRPLVLEPYIVAYFGDLLLMLEQQVQQLLKTLCNEELNPDDQ